MNEPTPAKLRAECAADPYSSKCARAAEGGCSGRITGEQAWICAGQEIQEEWAIIPLCWFHHLGAGLNKARNQLIALLRATPDDLAKYPRVNWERRLQQLLNQ